MYIFPPLVFISSTVIILYATQKSITFVLEKQKSNHVTTHHVRSLPSVTSLPCRSPAIEGSPQRKTSTVESAYSHQGIRIRLLLPEPYYRAKYRTRTRIAHRAFPEATPCVGPYRQKWCTIGRTKRSSAIASTLRKRRASRRLWSL